MPLFQRSLLLLLVFFLLPQGEAKASLTEERPIAVLRALDKITARVEELNIKVGDTLHFGTLEISVKTCKAAPPEDAPDAAAFVQVTEEKTGEVPTPIFSGWMFASSPALSAMEHPIYDLWVTGCKNTSTN